MTRSVSWCGLCLKPYSVVGIVRDRTAIDRAIPRRRGFGRPRQTVTAVLARPARHDPPELDAVDPLLALLDAAFDSGEPAALQPASAGPVRADEILAGSAAKARTAAEEWSVPAERWTVPAEEPAFPARDWAVPAEVASDLSGAPAAPATPRGLVVAVLDVGSRARLAWWRKTREGDRFVQDPVTGHGSELVELVEVLARDLQGGSQVALGFEAPLFVPLPESTDELGRRRDNEGSRPWSAGAGAVLATYATQQVTWVLRQLAQRCPDRPIRVSLAPDAIWDPEVDLFLWEAVIASKAPAGGDPRMADARAAGEEMCDRAEQGPLQSDVTADEVFSLLGAAVLRAGLSADISYLSQPAVVVKVDDR